MSRGEKALDDQNIDLENTPLAALRQHRPRKVQRDSAAAAKVAAVIVEDVIVMAPPSSPYSIPPPSPCKTPSWPINSPIRRQSVGQHSKPPNTPGNDVYYYDLNLNCATQGERRPRTESESVVEIIAPRSVEMVHDSTDDFYGGNPADKKPLRPIIVKQEVLDSQAVEKINTIFIREHDSHCEVGAEEEVDQDEEDETDDEDDDEDDEDEEDSSNLVDGLDLSNLVVIEAVDGQGQKAFKVHLMDTETDEMSEEPLDLPQEVIDYIVEAHQKTQQPTY